MSKTTKAPYQRPIAEVLKSLEVEAWFGLSSELAARRFTELGANELPRGPALSPLKIFLGQFKDLLVIILIIAAAVSFGLGWFEKDASIIEPLLIFAIVIAIAVVGFLNEYRANRTLEALRTLVSLSCRIRRDGQERQVATKELVPGDIVLCEAGQKVPADLRLITVNHLQVDESSLTGESVSVAKQAVTLESAVDLADRRNMLFSGTLITTGVAEAVVVATGARTEIGAIATLVESVEIEATPMQRKLDELGRRLGLVILAVCVIVFVAIFFDDHATLDLSFARRVVLAFTAAVALAVAAIPEGLAFVVRISLALGARRLAAKHALVRKLSAVEALGSTDVICTDKTGTLTRGQMTVRDIFVGKRLYELSGIGYSTVGRLRSGGRDVGANDDVLQLMEIGVLCNDARLTTGKILGDPTEGALLVAAAKVGLRHDELLQDNPRVHEVPFSAERKSMSTVHQRQGDLLVAVKGAPDLLLARCSHILDGGRVRAITSADHELFQSTIKLMASKALRVLGFAYKTIDALPRSESALENDLIFVGLQGMLDPPRSEVKAVVQRVEREAGMRVVMITGDNIETAKAIAKEVGIGGEALSGDELDRLSEQQLQERVERVGIFARVNPEHKIAIIRALQAKGHQVAMTGDGVNDAPAIKAADIGVAMGSIGTDVAKEAADMILLDDRFLTIISAIEEGRGIYDNVRKFVNFLLSCNIAEVVIVFLGILIHGNLVLTAAQLLFVNIITDGLPAVALGSDPTAANVMQRSPSYFRTAILSKRVWAEIVVFGALMSAVVLVHYSLRLSIDGAVAASSVVFLGVVVYEFVRLVDIRTDYRLRWWSNPWLSVSIAASLVIQVALFYIPPVSGLFSIRPITVGDWLYIALAGVGLFLIMKFLNPIFDHVGPENE